MDLYEIDHTEKAVGRITQDLSKPNFEKFVSVYTEELQQVEEALLVLARQKDIEQASGVWLDYIGKLVGEDRGGKNDTEYRAALAVKVGINTADGTPDVMIDLVSQYTQGDYIGLREGSLAWGVLSTNGEENIDGTLWKLTQDIKPIGTKWLVHSDYFDSAFRPAWEVAQTISEEFQTTDDGVALETFETTDDTITYEKFFTTSEGASYLSSSIGRDTLYWEGDPVQELQVFTGSVLETLEVTTTEGTKPFSVILEVEEGEEGEIPSNIRPLYWEIFENSLPIRIPPPPPTFNIPDGGFGGNLYSAAYAGEGVWLLGRSISGFFSYWRTEDHGETWTDITLDGIFIPEFMDGDGNGTVVVGGDYPAKFKVSHDYGLTWTDLPNNLGQPDNNVREVVWGGGTNWGVRFTGGRYAFSVDSGDTWTLPPQGLNSGATAEGNILRGSNGTWLMGMAGGYAARSANGGVTWAAETRGLGMPYFAQEIKMVGLNETGRCLSASTNNDLGGSSSDSGDTWSTRSGWGMVDAATMTDLRYSNGRWLACWDNGQITYSDDNATTWAQMDLSAFTTGSWVRMTTINNTVMVIATTGEILISYDDGDVWQGPPA